MKQVKLTLETITPLFMSGANQKAVELRPSSFRGMMRFWWRAVRATDDPKTLKKEESGLFGGAGEGEGRSEVLIRIKSDYDKLIRSTGTNLEKHYALGRGLDKEENRTKRKDTGIRYLLYSSVLPGRERKFIKDGFSFVLEIASLNENALKKALASFWVSVFLGGFGTRARRGGGNLAIKEIGKSDLLDLDFMARGSSSEEIAKWLCENFNKAVRIICEDKPIKNFAVSYSNLSFSRFIIAKSPTNNWVESLNEVGEIFQDFRFKHRHKIEDTAVFGFPIRHRNNLIVRGRLKDSNNINRRSSPLIFKVLKSGDKYFWMVLRLTGEFLPEGGIIKANRTQKPDYRLIDEFWNELKEVGDEYVLNQPELLKKIVEQTKNQISPTRIILFGSRARGDAHKKADIDLAVETSESVGKIDINAPLDIVNLRKADEKLKEKIEREGVILYERNT